MKYLIILSLFFVVILTGCKQEPVDQKIYIAPVSQMLLMCKKLNNYGTCGIELSDCQDQLGNPYPSILCAHNVVVVGNPE